MAECVTGENDMSIENINKEVFDMFLGWLRRNKLAQTEQVLSQEIFGDLGFPEDGFASIAAASRLNGLNGQVQQSNVAQDTSFDRLSMNESPPGTGPCRPSSRLQEDDTVNNNVNSLGKRKLSYPFEDPDTTPPQHRPSSQQIAQQQQQLRTVHDTPTNRKSNHTQDTDGGDRGGDGEMQSVSSESNYSLDDPSATGGPPRDDIPVLDTPSAGARTMPPRLQRGSGDDDQSDGGSAPPTPLRLPPAQTVLPDKAEASHRSGGRLDDIIASLDHHLSVTGVEERVPYSDGSGGVARPSAGSNSTSSSVFADDLEEWDCDDDPGYRRVVIMPEDFMPLQQMPISPHHPDMHGGGVSHFPTVPYMPTEDDDDGDCPPSGYGLPPYGYMDEMGGYPPSLPLDTMNMTTVTPTTTAANAGRPPTPHTPPAFKDALPSPSSAGTPLPPVPRPSSALHAAADVLPPPRPATAQPPPSTRPVVVGTMAPGPILAWGSSLPPPPRPQTLEIDEDEDDDEPPISRTINSIAIPPSSRAVLPSVSVSSLPSTPATDTPTTHIIIANGSTTCANSLQGDDSGPTLDDVPYLSSTEQMGVFPAADDQPQHQQPQQQPQHYYPALTYGPPPPYSVPNFYEALREAQYPKEGAHVAWEGDSVPTLRGHPVRYEAFDIKVIYQVGKTGFEEHKEFPIQIDAVIAGRYQIMEHLGSAAFSRAVQCMDLKTGNMVCVKIIRNNKDFFDQSLDEIKLLQYINSAGNTDENNVLQLYDYFYHKEHLFLVCELLRDNLYEFSKFNRESGEEFYFTIPRLQRITIQVLKALRFVHRLGLIHCDLKPENILIKSYSRCEVKVIDFGSSCFTTDHLSSYVQSRCYRAPEVILGLPYGHKIDLFSLGGILPELLTGKVLFHNESIQTMLARMVSICGPFPAHILQRGRLASKYFTADGVVYEQVAGSEQIHYLYPKRTTLQRRSGTDDALFLDFITSLLQLDPDKRPTAEEALQHPWLSHDYGVTFPSAPPM